MIVSPVEAKQAERGVLEADNTFAEVVALVRTGAASTRPELGQLTGLKRAVISQRVDQAISAGIFDDGSLGASTGGRAPRRLRFRAEVGVIYSAILGTAHLSVGVTDLAGRILGSHGQPWDIALGPDQALTILGEMLDHIVAEQHISSPVWGVGLGVPGAVDFVSGRPTGNQIMPKWDNYDLRSWFEDRYGAPVWVDNDLNIMILEEWRRGRHLNPAVDGNIILMKVSNGVGAGIISNGQVHRGRNGSAGDIGHTSIAAAADLPCRCGQIGCLEAMAGGWALVRDATVAGKTGKTGRSPYLRSILDSNGSLTPEDISEGARRSDPVCVELVNRSATLIGETLATLVSFFNPGTVYLGGIIPSAGDLFLVGVRRAVYQHALPLATRDLQILHTDMEMERGITGGANLVIDQLFQADNLPVWISHSTPAGTRNLIYETTT